MTHDDDDVDRPEYSVCQFFKTGEYEYVRRGVYAEEAMTALGHYTNSVAAKCGMVVRVIVTDGGDNCCAEWIEGRFTFPPELVEEQKRREQMQ